MIFGEFSAKLVKKQEKIIRKLEKYQQQNIDYQKFIRRPGIIKD